VSEKSRQSNNKATSPFNEPAARVCVELWVMPDSAQNPLDTPQLAHHRWPVCMSVSGPGIWLRGSCNGNQVKACAIRFGLLPPLYKSSCMHSNKLRAHHAAKLWLCGSNRRQRDTQPAAASTHQQQKPPLTSRNSFILTAALAGCRLHVRYSAACPIFHAILRGDQPVHIMYGL